MRSEHSGDSTRGQSSMPASRHNVDHSGNGAHMCLHAKPAWQALGRCSDCSKTPQILVPCNANVDEGRQPPCASGNVGMTLKARRPSCLRVCCRPARCAATISCCPWSPACKCQLCCLKGSGEGRQDQDLRLGIEFLSIWSGSLRLLSAILGEPGVVSSWAEGGTSGYIVHREHA